jgi:hypothetical protein
MLVLGALPGGIIGFERNTHGWPAEFRAHMRGIDPDYDYFGRFSLSR